ncbi:hypothetical protein M5K25_015557 [Dendrobium thyrsiflorum]|uniref:Uncharacterized protein n=1 Tax=Dendrobium thyrsiflorum TaxID=117978 RepID=A0ABD0URG5_DENTH
MPMLLHVETLNHVLINGPIVIKNNIINIMNVWLSLKVILEIFFPILSFGTFEKVEMMPNMKGSL